MFVDRCLEGDEAAFNMVQEGVLLGLVKPVDFVHEEDGTLPPHPERFPGLVDDSPDLLHAREHG